MTAATKARKANPNMPALPDGSIWFREDRKLWVAIIGGKQPAARQTPEKVIAWMAKKHPELKPIVLEKSAPIRTYSLPKSPTKVPKAAKVIKVNPHPSAAPAAQ